MASGGSSVLSSSAPLDICRVPIGTRVKRVYRSRFADPLGFGKSPSRFSDPRPLPEHDRFGVLYLGVELKVCLLEAVLRDRRDGHSGRYWLSEAELIGWTSATIDVIDHLRLVDLRGDHPHRMGIATDAQRARDHTHGQGLSLAIHMHRESVDGIIYASRLNEQTNLAIYDRAIAKLRGTAMHPLGDDPALPQVLDDLDLAILP